jgi:hypothetical protein
MSGLIVTCSSCGQDYEPERADIVSGYTTWSRCPSCRQVAASETNRTNPHQMPRNAKTEGPEAA